MTEQNSKLAELNEEIEQSQSLPYCWVVNPENVKESRLKKDIESGEMPIGIFLPKEQAEAANLNAPDWAEPKDITFGSEENVKSGFLFNRIRCCVLHRSPLIVQYNQGNDSEPNWRFAGLAYNNGSITELGQKEKESSEYRLRAFNLLMLVDENNQLLHELPIKLTLGKGPGAGFSNEVMSFRKEVEKVFFKLQGLPEQRLSQRAHALTVLDMNFGWHKSGTNAPFTCPIHRKAPAIDEVGTSKDVTRRDRVVTLTGEDINNLLISKKSDAGQKIVQLWEDYKNYFNYPLVAQEDNSQQEQQQKPAESEFGEDDNQTEDVPF